MKYSVTLYQASQAHAALMALWAHIKPWIIAGHKLHVSVKPATRNLEQNALFHVLCLSLEKSRLPFAGKPRDKDAWKVLMISGHSVATKQGAEIVPGIEGEFVNIRESSAQMPVSRMASLIEYTLAYCAMHEILTLPQEQK